MFRYITLVLLALLAVTCAEWPNNTTTIELTFDKIMIVVLENQPLKASMKNPMMREILKRGTLLTDYHAMVNPSQPNYIGLVGGDLLGVSNDANYDLPQSNLVDLMEAKNVSWKAYQENYPGNCFAYDTTDGLYKRKHNPFMSFNNIRNNPKRCEKIVHSDELPKDLAAGTVPQYSFYTPNMNNNGHDTGLDYTANWLYNTFLPTYQDSYYKTGKSLLVITFDEGVPGDNRIFTLLIGSMIPEGYVDTTRYTHYSLLKLVEDNWGLGNLGRKDAKAPQITTRYWAEGGPSFIYEGGEVTIALIVLLPVAALLVVGLMAYSLYAYRKRKASKLRTEFALVDEAGDV